MRQSESFKWVATGPRAHMPMFPFVKFACLPAGIGIRRIRIEVSDTAIVEGIRW